MSYVGSWLSSIQATIWSSIEGITKSFLHSHIHIYTCTFDTHLHNYSHTNALFSDAKAENYYIFASITTALFSIATTTISIIILPISPTLMPSPLSSSSSLSSLSSRAFLISPGFLIHSYLFHTFLCNLST